VFCGGQSQVDVDVLLGFCSDNRLQCHHLTLAAEHWGVWHVTPLFIYTHEISLLLVVCPQNLQVLQKYILPSVILLVGNHRPVLTQVSIASFLSPLLRRNPAPTSPGVDCAICHERLPVPFREDELHACQWLVVHLVNLFIVP
jgi:hypothetical protein